MSAKANPRLVGLFVVGAFALAVAGVTLFGGGGLFSSRTTYVLFFDEPSAGLDPISSRRLDDLILELRDSLGTTIVIVSHELASIFAVATNSIFLDATRRTLIAAGDPRDLRDHSPNPEVRAFLNRGEPPVPASPSEAPR